MNHGIMASVASQEWLVPRPPGETGSILGKEMPPGGWAPQQHHEQVTINGVPGQQPNSANIPGVHTPHSSPLPLYLPKTEGNVFPSLGGCREGGGAGLAPL